MVETINFVTNQLHEIGTLKDNFLLMAIKEISYFSKQHDTTEDRKITFSPIGLHGLNEMAEEYSAKKASTEELLTAIAETEPDTQADVTTGELLGEEHGKQNGAGNESSDDWLFR